MNMLEDSQDSFTKITGQIPRNIGCLAKLVGFLIGANAITGTIPASLGNISNLQYLDCPNSSIVGQIPPELGKLSNLRELNFFQNYNLIGQILEAIFNISSLEMIGLSFNSLSGRIPAITGLHLPNLRQPFLGENQIKGEIPLFITNASKLEILGLENNFLTGTIPTNLGNLRELQELHLQSNQLTNEPREHELRFFNSLGNCRMLRYLIVGLNPLNGILPDTIGNLSSTLKIFEIALAHISGFIPTSTGNISEDNELYGLIPECLGNLSMLQDIFLSSNKLSSKFPSSLCKKSSILHLDVSQNSIEGEVPQYIGGLKAIIELCLSSNHFSGKIPSKCGDLQNLISLDLSNNSFSGSIPLSFANLISLEELDLSLNALSGNIPKSLEKLLYLKAINVSFNNLEGEIPGGGVFANSTLQSFLGNKGLCGMHILEVPACAITNRGQQSKSKELVLKVVTPVVISSFIIFLLVSIWLMKRQKKGKSKDVEKVPEIRTYQLVSYHEIQRATNNFDGSNLIGVGGSGSVYKGTLSNGIVVAIKVLDLENDKVCERFDTECEVMRNVRHRNLVLVVTTCSSDYIRAFVLQYMPNGSLENWLYKEELHLNLLERLTIMLDVAVAIEYLHHGHETPIVHCDLKPANVLLDEDMVAHVGDFGISKISAVSKSMAHTETLGTLGYIAPGTMMDFMDANLFSEEEQITSKSEICIASMIELALDCTKEMPESRITMKDVVKRLNRIKNTFLEV
ncbi:hypothetical protein RND71_026682 [Anisodus tanguticus]|uniref:Protein kinase domain-containing protein n=1 Tax=Anisodus tanguticus TaxID=243964 RepID=A0AAE1V315_9SOLA|nr:hypothetical protein RND71_026682 [Anisodus tanguticus]